MVRVLRFVGLGWCYAVALVIAVALAAIAYRDGLWRVSEVLSPFNVANLMLTAAALAPGLLCLWAAGRIKVRR